VVPIFSLLAAFTLQPVLLYYFGRRGVSPVGLRGIMARRAVREGHLGANRSRVTRRPLLVLVSSLVVLAGLSASVLGLALTPGSVTAIPQGMQSAQALDLCALTWVRASSRRSRS